MLWPKKNSHKELGNEKKFMRLENSPPPHPITFLMVRPLFGNSWYTSYCIRLRMKNLDVCNHCLRFLLG